jgi:hypothetical protein
MIFAVVLLILTAAVTITMISKSNDKNVDILYSVNYSKKVVTKQLPKFSHLVIRNNFSKWFRNYVLAVNNQNGINDMHIYADGKSEIQLSKEIMDFSSFTMHGDTMVITLGCPKDFARNLFREIKKEDFSKNGNNYGQFESKGHYYSLVDGGIMYKAPYMDLHTEGKIKSITYASIFNASIHQLHQDSLNLNTEMTFTFDSCEFYKLNTINGNNKFNVQLNNTKVKKLYLNINNDFGYIDDKSYIDEYYFIGNKDNATRNDVLSQINYNHPFTLHWLPTK